MAFHHGCHLHLIDGSAFIFRAYHALPPLTRKSDGMPIGAVAGFCNMLFHYIEGNKGIDAPTHIAVIFDHSSKTFRNDIYPAYKANRPELPPDLRPQFPLTREATRAFNIACIETEGYEADDIIATLAHKARTNGGRVTIISSDKDLMQLVGDGVVMFDAMKNKLIDREGVFEKFGVAPEQVVDVQALAGDSVDNVPGAPGIGLKTAALLIQEYGSLEALLDAAPTIKQPKRRAALVDHADLIRISKRLVALDADVPLNFDDHAFEVTEPDPAILMAFLTKMEFRTLTKRVSDSLKVAAPAQPAAPEPQTPDFGALHYETVTTKEALQGWIDAIYERGHVAFDTETTGLDEMVAGLVGISLCVQAGKACYIPLAHREGGGDLFSTDQPVAGQLALNEVIALLKPMLEDPSILKIGQNIKYDYKIMARHHVRIHPFDDTMLLSYALHGGLHGHGMDALSQRYLGHTPVPIKSLLGSGKSAITFDRVALDKATRYAAEDADITLRLWQLLRPKLGQEQVTTVYETLERPLVTVLADMEMAGVEVDRMTLAAMSAAFEEQMKVLEGDIHTLAGMPFNVASPKQLGEVMFDRLGLPGGEKGKSGAYGTGADVLEDLAAEGHALPAKMLDWRLLAKLKSTYTDALQDHINARTGRVHTSYHIAGANTGRLASTDPNLQNIPIRSEEGRRIRAAFIAPKGRVLVSLDYSQIELRILAHIANIPALKEAFYKGQDIHAMTAAEMFNVPIEGMDPMIRRRAKAINFGVIYGISAFGLARNLRIPRAEAQGFITRYFERFPEIQTYMNETVAFARENGFVRTLFGRKIHTPEINAKGPGAGLAKRGAINAPIQGTAADIIRRAMIKMPAAIAGLDAKMLLQVHDELLFEVAEDEANTLITRAKTIMEKAAEPAVKLSLPLVVEAGIGTDWGKAH